MTALISFLVFCQILGALFGALSVVWGEFAYIRALRDGKLESAERVHLKTIGHGMRLGMSLLLLASLGLVVISFILNAQPQPAVTPAYWVYMMLALLVILLTFALARGWVAFGLGSAAVFSAWWFLAYLVLGSWSVLSFGAAVAAYVVVTMLMYGLLSYLRMFAAPLPA